MEATDPGSARDLAVHTLPVGLGIWGTLGSKSKIWVKRKNLGSAEGNNDQQNKTGGVWLDESIKVPPP